MSGVLNVLLGLGGARVVPPSYNVTDTGDTTAHAGIEFKADGSVTGLRVFQGNEDLGNWIEPPSLAPGAYTIRADVLSGTLTTGTTGTDLALSSSRSWTVQRNSEGTSTVQLQLSIKLGGSVVAQGTTILEAVVTP